MVFLKNLGYKNFCCFVRKKIKTIYKNSKLN